MDPTRPIDSKTVREAGRTPISPISRVDDVTTGKAEGRLETDQVAGGLEAFKQAVEVVRAQAEQLDAARLTELRTAVSEGRYQVAPDALADRILDDAFGPELT